MRTPLRPTASVAALLTAALAAAQPAPSPTGTAIGASPAAAPTTHGIDVAGLDRGVKPGDDFFSFANGTWFRTTEIPADRRAWGVFDILDERSRVQVRTLLEAAGRSAAAPGSIERKVGDFYATALDEAAAESKGLAPVKPALARVAALRSKRDLSRWLGEALRADVDALNSTDFHTPNLFGMWVAPDMNAPSTMVAYLLQGGLELPDREYYVSDTPKMKEIREKYRAHVAKVLSLAGIPDAEARAGRIVDLETKMARAHATRAESLEVKLANNPWTKADWAKKAPGIDWTAFFAAAGLDKQRVVFAWHPKATAGLSALVAKEPLESWKDWATFHVLDDRSAYLSRAFADESFDFKDRVLSGNAEQSARWKRAQRWTDDAIGEAVGRLYVEHHFTPEAKAKATAMVKAISDAFVRRIDALDWLAPATKAKAKEKVAALYVGIGYPDRWTDFSGLEVVRGDLVGNVERAALFLRNRRLAQLGKPVDRAEWCLNPQTVNAVNLPLQNSLNFPAAILQPPFYDPEAPSASNYGSIGAVIGHEISHSFDDQGALFGPTGKLENWWTKEDFAHFEASGAQLVAQYDAYRPLPDLHVNGKQTLSENIADVAGLSAAHDAWVASLGGQPAPVLQGFSGEQQFFLAFAQSWRDKDREAFLRQRVVTDGHAPDEFRADAVRNLDAWYPAFDVQPGQRLYLAPKDRVRVW